MSGFLIVFLAVYSTMHALFYHRVRVLLPEQWAVHGLVIVFLLLMVAAPMGSYLLERSGHDPLGRLVAIVGFSWMGFIFISFWLVLLMDIFDVISWGLGALFRFPAPTLSGSAPALVMLGLAAVICTYATFEARTLLIERVRIHTDKLPAGIDRFKIAQISDVHVGLLARNGRISRIVDIVQREQPDMLVCTGDLVDGAVGHLKELPAIFERAQPPYGKFAVTGNHEAYAGLGESLEFFRQSGFTVLRGTGINVRDTINVAGIDDPAISRSENEKQLLTGLHNGLFTLFLKHRPQVLTESLGLFDLQLSGHTHRGQIFPFNYIVATQYPLMDGLYELGSGSRLYTSRGTGSWGPQMRLHSPPEITIFELVRSASQRR